MAAIAGAHRAFVAGTLELGLSVAIAHGKACLTGSGPRQFTKTIYGGTENVGIFASGLG
jgi:hypothetical protein